VSRAPRSGESDKPDSAGSTGASVLVASCEIVAKRKRREAEPIVNTEVRQTGRCDHRDARGIAMQNVEGSSLSALSGPRFMNPESQA
jgi:hypothetical protein